jgi:hypothetical protein
VVPFWAMPETRKHGSGQAGEIRTAVPAGCTESAGPAVVPPYKSR